MLFRHDNARGNTDAVYRMPQEGHMARETLSRGDEEPDIMHILEIDYIGRQVLAEPDASETRNFAPGSSSAYGGHIAVSATEDARRSTMIPGIYLG